MVNAKTASLNPNGTVVALCGGVGGAKLALGLSHVVPDERLLVCVNTGDDFEHLGLDVSPDIDTVTYTLAGVANPVTGWGRADESWNFMEALGDIGGDTWFALGDRDLALNVERTHRLRAGDTLTAITKDICRNFGITAQIVPMSDDPVHTIVDTDAGTLPFQSYFVERRCAPVMKSVSFAGADSAKAQPDFLAALTGNDLRAVVICPSNPYLSIDSILSVAGVREALRTVAAPVVAVSPVVGGRAVKGPMAKIMGELGLAVTHATIAEHYADLIDGIMVDGDGDHIETGAAIMVGSTMMNSIEDRVALAHGALAFADSLATERSRPRERIA